MKKMLNWKFLIICLVVVYAVAFLGSIFTSSQFNTDWYQSVKSSLTPPNYVFPIVWNILFFLIGLSLYFAWMNAKGKSQKNKVVLYYGINLFFNFAWSILYFWMHKPLFAFIDIILIWISILWLIIFTRKISVKSSWLLVPYFLWVSFASYLNWVSI